MEKNLMCNKLVTHIATHVIKKSCEIHTAGGQLLQEIDITIRSCFFYLVLLFLEYQYLVMQLILNAAKYRVQYMQ